MRYCRRLHARADMELSLFWSFVEFVVPSFQYDTQSCILLFMVIGAMSHTSGTKHSKFLRLSVLVLFMSYLPQPLLCHDQNANDSIAICRPALAH